MFPSSGMTKEQYAALPKWLRVAYWIIIASAVGLILYVWL
jgi:hypothetical protein